MLEEEKEIKRRFGIVNFERRKHPRFCVNLPVEYWQINNCKSHPGRAVNICEGGLLLYLPHRIEIGQNLRLKLFIDNNFELTPLDAFVCVVWNDFHIGENGDYRTGVKFVDISPENFEKLKSFLNSLINLKTPSESNIPSRLLSGFGISTLKNFSNLSTKANEQD